MTSNKEQGQALIESLYTSVGAFLFFTFIASAFYLYYAKAISSYYSHKALLCCEELHTSLSDCKKDLDKNIKKGLFFSKKLSTELFKSASTTRAVVSFKFLRLHFQWEKQLRVKIQ